MPTPDLTTEQRNFLDLYALEIESIVFAPRAAVRSVKEALEQMETSTFLRVRRREDTDGGLMLTFSPRAELTLRGSLDDWMTATESLRNRNDPTMGLSSYDGVTWNQAEKALREELLNPLIKRMAQTLVDEAKNAQ
jgi:hypothetical protein